MTGANETASSGWRTPCFGLRVRPKTAIFALLLYFAQAQARFSTPAGVPEGRVSENALLGAVFVNHNLAF